MSVINNIINAVELFVVGCFFCCCSCFLFCTGILSRDMSGNYFTSSVKDVTDIEYT